MTTALVTGGSGFIGRHLVRALTARGDRVRVLTRHNSTRFDDTAIETVAGDLARPETLIGLCQGVDTVFHLAGYAHADDANDRSASAVHSAVTVAGTRHLLDCARAAGVRGFVFTSSIKAMGEETADCVDESATPRPETAYGRAKLAAEQLLLDPSRDQDCHVVVLRLPVVFGGGDRGNLSRLIRAVARGRFPALPASTGLRSYVAVEDVVSACLAAGSDARAAGSTYLVTDGEPITTHELVALIRSALGRRASRFALPQSCFRLVGAVCGGVESLTGMKMPYNPHLHRKLFTRACYVNDRICTDLGFRPTRTLRASIADLARACRAEAR